MDASMAERVEKLAEEIAEEARTQEDLNGLMRLMMKSALQRMLDTELEVHLGRWAGSAAEESEASSAEGSDGDSKPVKTVGNRRNGYSPKTVKGEMGQLTLDIPRDRNATFQPQLIPKHQRRIPGFDEKILALYAKGMTTRDIQDVLRELYGVEVSPTLISEITSDIDQDVTTWRTRPLEAVWPIVYFDGLVVHVRGGNGRVSKHTIYVAIGVNLEGRKELLGLWLSENEGAKFWLSVLTDMKNRGLKDLFVACIDGLTGFADAIHTAYPETKVQLCVVHLVRAALRDRQGQQSGGLRSEENLQRRHVDRSRRRFGRIRSSLGREISDDFKVLAGEVAGHHHAVRFSLADPQSDLDDQRHRIGQQRDPQTDTE